MLPKTIVISIPVFIAFGVSTVAFAKERTLVALAQLTGAGFLVIVIFAHVSEAFNLFPSMGWGRPHTLGHYIDLTCAIAGVLLLSMGYFSRRLSL